MVTITVTQPVGTTVTQPAVTPPTLQSAAPAGYDVSQCFNASFQGETPVGSLFKFHLLTYSVFDYYAVIGSVASGSAFDILQSSFLKLMKARAKL